MASDPKSTQGTNRPPHISDKTLTSVSSGIAAIFLERNIREGKGSEIPSLGIVIEKKVDKK